MHPSSCLILVLFIYNCHVTHSLSSLVDHDHHGTNANASTHVDNWPETNSSSHEVETEPTKPRMTHQEQRNPINGNKASTKQRPRAELERQNRRPRSLLGNLNNSSDVAHISRIIARQTGCADGSNCVACINNPLGCKYSLYDATCQDNSATTLLSSSVITSSKLCPKVSPGAGVIFGDFPSDVNVPIANIESITMTTDFTVTCEVYDHGSRSISPLTATKVSANNETYFTCPLSSLYPLNSGNTLFRLDMAIWYIGTQIDIDKSFKVTVRWCSPTRDFYEPFYDCQQCIRAPGCGWCSVQKCSSKQHCEKDIGKTWTSDCPPPVLVKVTPPHCSIIHGNTIYKLTVNITQGFIPGLNPPFEVKLGSKLCDRIANGTVFECTTLPVTVPMMVDVTVTRGVQTLNSTVNSFTFEEINVLDFFPADGFVSTNSEIEIYGNNLKCGGKINITIGDRSCVVAEADRSEHAANCLIKHDTTGMLKKVSVTIDSFSVHWNNRFTVLASHPLQQYSLMDIDILLQELGVLLIELKHFPTTQRGISDTETVFQAETGKLFENINYGIVEEWKIDRSDLRDHIEQMTSSRIFTKYALSFVIPSSHSFSPRVPVRYSTQLSKRIGRHMTTFYRSLLVEVINGMIETIINNTILNRRLQSATSIRYGTSRTLNEMLDQNHQLSVVLRGNPAVQDKVISLLTITNTWGQGGSTQYSSYLTDFFAVLQRTRSYLTTLHRVCAIVKNVAEQNTDIEDNVTKVLDMTNQLYGQSTIENSLWDDFQQSWSTNSISKLEETVSLIADHAVTIPSQFNSSINQFTTALKYTIINRNEDAQSVGKRIALKENTTVKNVLERLETTLGRHPGTCAKYSRPVDNNVLYTTLRSFNDKVTQLLSMRQLIERSIVDQFLKGFATKVVMVPQNDQEIVKQLKDIHCTIVKTFMAYPEVGGNAALKDIGLNNAMSIIAILDELTKKLDSTLWTTDRATESKSTTLQHSTSNADYCPPLGSAENMNMLIDQFPYDGKSTVIHSSVVELSCKQGYRFIGTNQSITCHLNYGETAKWTNANYACQRLKCSKLSPRVYRLLHYVNSTLEGQQYNGTDEVEVFDIIGASCEDGYRLVGPKAIRCIVNNITGIPVWNDTMHECVEKWPWAPFRHNLSWLADYLLERESNASSANFGLVYIVLNLCTVIIIILI